MIVAIVEGVGMGGGGIGLPPGLGCAALHCGGRRGASFVKLNVPVATLPTRESGARCVTLPLKCWPVASTSPERL